MNILITGAGGFIGRNFLHLLKQENYFSNDTIILLSSKVIEGYKCILHKDYTFQKSDFFDAGINTIDIVFHMGASVPKINTEDIFKYTMNVRNTIHLFENMPNIPQKIIFISSVSVYKNEGSIINETQPFQYDTMYGVSKIMCEKYLEKKAEEYGFILQILRLGQIYGPGEEVYSKIVSSFINQISENQQITIWGDGSAVRSMLFVGDCCSCIIQASLYNEYLGPVNIVSSQAVNIKELIQIIYLVCNKNPNVKYINNKTAIVSNIFDASKMQQYFKIKETSLHQGIKFYYDYYIKERISL